LLEPLFQQPELQSQLLLGCCFSCYWSYFSTVPLQLHLRLYQNLYQKVLQQLQLLKLKFYRLI
jgi:hypothetical protein